MRTRVRCVVMTPTAARELIAVAPRGQLRTLRLADANELEPFTQAREADVIGRDAQLRGAEKTVALLDRFPAVLDRREIPADAPATDDPEAAVRCIEGEPATDGKMLDRFVLAEVGVAENASRVHAYIYTLNTPAHAVHSGYGRIELPGPVTTPPAGGKKLAQHIIAST